MIFRRSHLEGKVSLGIGENSSALSYDFKIAREGGNWIKTIWLELWYGSGQ